MSITNPRLSSRNAEWPALMNNRSRASVLFQGRLRSTHCPREALLYTITETGKNDDCLITLEMTNLFRMKEC